MNLRKTSVYGFVAVLIATGIVLTGHFRKPRPVVNNSNAMVNGRGMLVKKKSVGDIYDETKL